MTEDRNYRMERTAIIEVTPELLRDGLGPLFDHGLSVIGSIDGAHDGGRLVRLLIAGPGLPPECGSGEVKTVAVTFQRECYGRQHIDRVADIRVVDVRSWDRSGPALEVVRSVA